MHPQRRLTGPDRRLGCAKGKVAEVKSFSPLEIEVVEVRMALQKWSVGVLRELRLTGGVAV